MTRTTLKPKTRRTTRGRSPIKLTGVRRLETPGCYYAAGIFARAPEIVFQVHLADQPGIGTYQNTRMTAICIRSDGQVRWSMDGEQPGSGRPPADIRRMLADLTAWIDPEVETWLAWKTEDGLARFRYAVRELLTIPADPHVIAASLVEALLSAANDKPQLAIYLDRVAAAARETNLQALGILAPIRKLPYDVTSKK